MKKWLGRIIGLVVVVAIVLLVVARFNSPTEEIETVELPMVTLGYATTGDMESSISLMGTIEPSDTYYIMPKVAGDLLEVYVENGQSVSKGDPIALIDNEDAIASARYTLDQASASASTAQSTLARTQPLYEAGDISAQEYESARANADAARAQLNSAQLNYDLQVEYATVVAPADGVIQNLDVSINATVSQSTQLAVLVGSGAKTINFNVTEDVMRNLSLGEEVTVDKSGVEISGQITEIGGVVNSSTGLYPIKAVLSDADGLTDGAKAKVSIISAKSENTIIIPLDYVYYSDSIPYVYIYNGENVETREIELGIQNNVEAEVISGISTSDQIITSWTKEIYDGASVRIAE